MIPAFLLPESLAREDGQGAQVALGASQGRPLLFTLGITRILEQESLEVSISGSEDGETWRELAVFPQKCYCGTYSIFLDLSEHPEVRYLRANWKMSRWARGGQKPLFGFYVFAEELHTRVAGAA